METPVGKQSTFDIAPSDLATVTCLLKTLWLFTLIMSFAMLAIELADVSDTLHLDDFLYAIGSTFTPSLTFLAMSMCTSVLYIGAIVLEPVILPVWRQSCRIKVAVQTFLLRRLWTLVYRIAIKCVAFLFDERVPYRDPDEATGLRKFDNPEVSERFIHRWFAGTSPHLIFH